MAVLPIRITGDPVLHTPATAVLAFDDELHALIQNMFDTMDAAPGVGLAAPQVGIPLRVFVYGWRDDDGVLHRGVAINPQLWISPTPIGEPDDEDESEGCLSVPGERFPLRRAQSAILHGLDEHKQPFELHADGWLARIFQHEFDHLDGVLYVDRLAHQPGKLAAKTIRKQGWGVAGKSWLPGVDHPED
jgi:peptide deformylase